MFTTATRLGALAAVLLFSTVGLTGCDSGGNATGNANGSASGTQNDTDDDGTDHDGQEVTGPVAAIDATSITVGATRYTVDAATRIEGFATLAAIAVGTNVDIEYETVAGVSHAIKIEDAAHDNNDDISTTP